MLDAIAGFFSKKDAHVKGPSLLSSFECPADLAFCIVTAALLPFKLVSDTWTVGLARMCDLCEFVDSLNAARNGL
jgi:hypothetical protein